MELIFHDQVVVLNDSPKAEDIILKINDSLPNGHYFSHIIIDGNAVHENYEEYIELRLKQIKKIEVILKTEKEFFNDLMISAEEYIEQAIPELHSLAQDFSDNPVPATWIRLDQLLGGLQWLDEILMAIGKSMNTPMNWRQYLEVSNAMNELIQNLAEAIENEDTVLIGDLIQYELVDTFEALQNEFTNTIDNEGTRYDLN